MPASSEGRAGFRELEEWQVAPEVRRAAATMVEIAATDEDRLSLMEHRALSPGQRPWTERKLTATTPAEALRAAQAAEVAARAALTKWLKASAYDRARRA